jgi:predicted phage terminase large subunit-like protein
MAFTLTQKQIGAVTMLGGDQTHTLLYGGSRSGKSFIILRTIINRAMHAPRSRHLMARFRLSHIKGSLVAETMPNVLSLCFPELEHEIDHKKSDQYYLFPNGSELWYAGLDDKDRTEKILGKEFATIFLNECSQIPWASRTIVLSRLAQKTWRPNPADPDGKKGLPLLPGLRLRAYYDENPPLKLHWTYKLFVEKKSPDTNRMVADPGDYNSMLINPRDNKDNLDPGYFKILDEMSERQRKRFRDGQFGEAGEGALWTEELLEQQRIDNDGDLPDLQRIVVAVDPSGADSNEDAHRDEIGIVVAALGTDGKAYVLEDLTMKGSPGEWGEAVAGAFKRWGADRVIGEENFGGAMVKFVVQTAFAKAGIGTAPYQAVTASRGKVVRAEPVAALYEAQNVWHLNGLPMLEAELCMMTTSGFLGDRSPNRADALVWALTALFPSVIKEAKALGTGRGAPPKINLGYAGMKARRSRG